MVFGDVVIDVQSEFGVFVDWFGRIEWIKDLFWVRQVRVVVLNGEMLFVVVLFDG